MTQSPAGVIFDFDGVVVDSLSVHLEAWRASYQALYGLELTDTTGLPGRSTAAIADILSQRAGRPDTKESLAEMKRDTLRKSRADIKLLPGAREAFEYLAGSGVPYGIASNAPREFIKTTLEHHDITVPHYFGIDDVARGKPEPDVFLKCAKALGISVLKHRDTIVFEDSPHGLRAAVKAGMFPIGVLTQNTAREMLTAGALETCEHLRQALDNQWLRSLPKPQS